MSMKRDVAEYKKHMEKEEKLEQIRLGKLDIMMLKALGRTGFALVGHYIPVSYTHLTLPTILRV